MNVHLLNRIAFVGVLLIVLNGCSMLVAGVVGAAVTPIVQPIVDRGLVSIGADWVDPAGTAAVKPTDSK